ncbi:MAG: hypothetical protein CML46_08925 [Rhodobacteraceae bacterium]|nr:hypothetical protein [Paracoccaceae bacterium]MBR27048.1 hypothetical protein [Paracoccaceae bacterium]
MPARVARGARRVAGAVMQGRRCAGGEALAGPGEAARDIWAARGDGRGSIKDKGEAPGLADEAWRG